MTEQGIPCIWPIMQASGLDLVGREGREGDIALNDR